MEKRWNFATTKVRTPTEYATPVAVPAGKYLISTGPSLLGSHAISSLLRCPRRWALPAAGMGPMTVPTPLAPRRRVDGPTTDVIADTQWDHPHAGRSVYMTRGTLVHVAAAHAAARLGCLQHGGTVVMGHQVTDPDVFYTPEEAIEVTAGMMGVAANAVALPVARRVGPAVVQWLEQQALEWRILAVETQYAYWTSGVEVAHTARVDLLLEHKASGLVRVWDYKTANHPKSAANEYRYGLQVRGLERIGATHFGSKWDGVWLLCAKDPGREAKTGEASITLEEYAMGRVRHMDGRFDDLLRATRGIMNQWGAKPARSWPVIPSHCSDCPVLVACEELG